MARIEKWDEVHGNQAPDEKMMAFLDSFTDQYAILQLRRSEDTVYERFSSMRELERMRLEPNIDHYEVVYTAPLLPYNCLLYTSGRQTANGLMGKCDIIPKSEAKPGDLIFFQKTYNTSGASHVGIYVGNGMMIHCGNPISYASIETNYWRQHYYCMGRIR